MDGVRNPDPHMPSTADIPTELQVMIKGSTSTGTLLISSLPTQVIPVAVHIFLVHDPEQ